MTITTLSRALFVTIIATQASPAGRAPALEPPAGIWVGTVRDGERTEALAFDIRKLPDGLGLYMTLPRLHAWRMPVDYVTPRADGTWAVPGWHITMRLEGERLTGEYADPRVRFELSRATALPPETPAPSYPTGPNPDWTYAAGAPLWASPASREGVIYAADTKGAVHALRARDGTRIWRVESGAAIYGAPAVTLDAIFVFDDGGALRRLDRGTGREVWRAALGADPAPRILPEHNVFDFDFHAPTPVVDGASIIVTTSQGRVHAVDAATGAIQWKADLGAKVRATAAVSDALVVVGTMRNDVVALDRRSGAEKWRFTMTGPVTSAPTIADGLVIAASRGARLTAIDAATGGERWSRFEWSSWVESDGVVNDGVYYVGSSDLREVRAIDPRSGRSLWETDVLGWAWGTPAITSGTVFIGVAGPRQYVTKHAAGLVAIDRKTGAVRWRRPVMPGPDAYVSGYAGSVIVEDGVLVAPNVDGTLEGFRIAPAGRE